MSEYITDENGKWLVDGKARMLVEPSSAWIAKNQAINSEDIKQKLSELDNPRDAEAIFDALKAKGILSDGDLPAEVVERFDQKKALREQLQEL